MTLALLCPSLVPSSAEAQGRVLIERWRDVRPVERGDALMQVTVLASHNQVRKSYGAPPLAWNAALAADAMVYARILAQTARFQHDPQTGRKPRQGENLWMGTRGAYTYAEMMAPLIDERRVFRPGKFPDVSRTGNWRDVAHYTQIVWPGSTSVGCALASNARDDYFVCRYAPAGNVVGVVMR